MDDCEPRELELTPELIEYANSIALHEAEKRCPKYVDYGDVAQEVLLHLVSKPPKYDPTKGASAKTLIHTIVQRGVLKYVARQCRHTGRFKQVDEANPRHPKTTNRSVLSGMPSSVVRLTGRPKVTRPTTFCSSSTTKKVASSAERSSSATTT